MVYNDTEELRDVVFKEWDKLFNVRRYLNEAGLGKLEAYRSAYFYFTSYNTLEELYKCEGFLGLKDIKNMHPEYYKTLNLLYNSVKNHINNDKEI